MYDIIARPLEFFYGIWPNYAGAISLLTLSIMIILLPLTLKGTRSMLAMQKLQPELKKLQNKHRDDRQKLNEEVMKFYKENNINPMSGCFPLLLQMPVFFVLYRTLFQLLNRAPYGYDMGGAVARTANGVNKGVFEQFGYFRPKHLGLTSELYQDLNATREMRSFGINLAESAQKAFSHGLVNALPFLVLVLGVTATSYYQQRQIAGRNPQAAAANPQQQMLMKIMPLFFAFISLTLPAGIVVYFLVSNLFRIAQQAFITRTMYRDEDGAVATTGHEVDTSSTEKPKGLLAALREQGLPSPAKAREEARAGRGTVQGRTGTKTAGKPAGKGGAKAAPGAATSKTDKPAAPSRSAAGPSRSAPTSANRSRTKKKRK
ncbi:MAG: OxaA family protein [Acidimicrobiales bacterium]|nr:OxaA family protein [Acidimicrobiales bacterium]